MRRQIYFLLFTVAILIGCNQEASKDYLSEDAVEAVLDHDPNRAKLLGYWFQPEGALRNIAFWPDGEFVFNEWEGTSLPRRGMFELKGDRLALMFHDGETKLLTFGKVRDDDPNWYITGGETMVRGVDLLPPEEPLANEPPMPKRLSDFLNSQLSESILLPADHWLNPQYLKSYNTNDLVADKISYPDDVLTTGDFNGDRLTDYAGLFVDNDGSMTLIAFHSRHDTGLAFKQYTVASLQRIEQCCAGVGVKVSPPGTYKKSGDDSDALLDIATDSLLLRHYEKSEQAFYFTGEIYSSY